MCFDSFWNIIQWKIKNLQWKFKKSKKSLLHYGIQFISICFMQKVFFQSKKSNFICAVKKMTRVSRQISSALSGVITINAKNAEKEEKLMKHENRNEKEKKWWGVVVANRSRKRPTPRLVPLSCRQMLVPETKKKISATLSVKLHRRVILIANKSFAKNYSWMKVTT